VDPCIPSSWPGYEIAWRLGRTSYVISVLNPERQCRGVCQALVDDDVVDATAMPIVEDGQTHHVRIVIGR
jgi:cyclic beta-1,2-glucan synthetase